MNRLPDHDLSVLVEAAAEGSTNSWAAHRGSTQWDDMTAGQKNLVRETALPFIYHGTKALAELGYQKPRTIRTLDELEALKLPAIIDSPSGGPAKVEYYAGPGGQKYVEPLFYDDDADDEYYNLTFFASFGLPATVLHEASA